MRVRRLRIDSRNIVWFIFILGVIVALAMIIYFPTYSRYKKLREENIKMVKKIGRLKREINELEKAIKSLETGSFLLEKIARESIGVAKDDEIVIDIKD